MKRKSKNFEEAKKAFLDLRDKILAATPELQQRAINLMSELIENSDDEQLKDFFTEYRDIIKNLIQTEAKSNEK
jgi:uncharacterized protein YbgA (DUF1722 family)